MDTKMKHWWKLATTGHGTTKAESGRSGSVCRTEIRHGLLWIQTRVFAVTSSSIHVEENTIWKI